MAIKSTYKTTFAKKAAGITSAALLGISCYLPFSAQASTIPGEIILVAGQCPGGFLPADGSQVDLTAYPELAAVVQNSYGGSNATQQIGLPSVDASSVLEDDFDYVYEDVTSLSSDASAYLVKVSDDRGLRDVIEVEIGKRDKGDWTDPQAFIDFIASFEKQTGTTVENYVIRTGSGFSLANGEAVERGTEASFWFGAYCTGNNGTCAQTNKGIASVKISDLDKGDRDGSGRPIRSIAVAGYQGSADDSNDRGNVEPDDFAPFQPQYCVAVGGDTAPLVEVGLTYNPSAEDPNEGLEFTRVDVSGLKYDDLGLDGCFVNGDLCLDQLMEANPGINRPNIAFRLVGENVCRATEYVEVTSYEPCEGAGTGGTGDNGSVTVVSRYVWDDATLNSWCAKMGGRKFEGDNFCESNDDGPKLNKSLCNRLGGEKGDATNAKANSPICLPPEEAYEKVAQRDPNTDPALTKVSEQQCKVTTFEARTYPGELRLSGVQIARAVYGGYPSDEDWGDHYDLFSTGEDVSDSAFTYITKRDENGRPGFVAADLVDERTLILENRNVATEEFNYRVQAECGEGDDATNVYYDPTIRHDGKGGDFPY